MANARNPPGAWPGAVNMQPPPYSPIAPDPEPPARNGIFPNIGQFMMVPNRDPQLQLYVRTASVADVKPGRIIYIRDEQTRLDWRVMLVLRRSTAGFTCIPFCLHQFPASTVDHWQVYTGDEGNPSARQARTGRLKIVLRPYGPNIEVDVAENITINIGDIWNVENVVNVAVLGFVNPRRLATIMHAVKMHFCHSLDRALGELEASHRPPPTTSSAYRRRWS